MKTFTVVLETQKEYTEIKADNKEEAIGYAIRLANGEYGHEWEVQFAEEEP